MISAAHHTRRHITGELLSTELERIMREATAT